MNFMSTLRDGDKILATRVVTTIWNKEQDPQRLPDYAGEIIVPEGVVSLGGTYMLDLDNGQTVSAIVVGLDLPTLAGSVTADVEISTLIKIIDPS